jgi:hypothetical protein
MAAVTPGYTQTDGAKESFDSGVELYNANDYKGALAEFLAAYKAKPHHSVLYNIAQCYKMIDAGAEALHYYELYLEEGADFISESRAILVQDEIEKLKSQLTPLTLTVKPDGASVLLDGQGIGKSPIGETQFIDPGEHVLMVQKTGHANSQRDFVAKRGQPLHIEVIIEKLEEAKPAGGKVPWGAPAGTGAVVLASGAAAIVLGVLSARHHNEFIDLRGEIAEGIYEGDDPQGAYKDAKDKGKGLNAGVGVTIGVAAVAAVVTAILIPLAVSKEKPVNVKTSGAGLSMTVSF